jgi:hypothetical protein
MSDSSDKPSEKDGLLSTEGNETYVERCSCGYDRHHIMVTPHPTYTLWGTFWVTLMGVSSIPIRIDFICRRCEERFDFIINQEELSNFL